LQNGRLAISRGIPYTLYMRFLGIDYGSVRVGTALSDERGVMGFPHKVFSNTPRLLDELIALVEHEKVGAIVIGHSRTLAGGENPIAEHAKKFGDALGERTGLAVVYESEVFTSAEARRAPHKEEKTRSPKSHEAVDASAAAIILTAYLSRT
jgi:putative holliday junction resolvase